MNAVAFWTSFAIGVVLILSVVTITLRIRDTKKKKSRIATSNQVAENPKNSPTNSVSTAVDGRVWVIANPTKPEDYSEFRREVSAAVLEKTGKPAMWIETTVEDPGTGQTIEALRHNPSVVLAAGGDGTVRAVAAGMAHSNVPLGLLPMGTGNLLARNLELPLNLKRALEVALTPISRRIDLAWMRLERVEDPPQIPAEGDLLKKANARSVISFPEGHQEPGSDEFAYVVIAGVGFDGETMAQTSPSFKKKVGWSAYVLTALKSLWIERMRATVTIFHNEGQDASQFKPRRSGRIPRAVEEAVRNSHTIGAASGVSPASELGKTWDMSGLRARTILFANCGTLPFAVLAPEAEIDDGVLDVIAIDTRAGIFGWMYLSAKVWGQSAGVRPINLKNDPGSIQFRQTASARVDISGPYPVQIDGDHIGSARTVIARVDPGALLIRVSQKPSRGTLGTKRDVTQS